MLTYPRDDKYDEHCNREKILFSSQKYDIIINLIVANISCRLSHQKVKTQVAGVNV